MQVKLTVRGVTDTEFNIPEFLPPPEVLLWRGRAFRRKRNGEYAECFAFLIPNEAAKDVELGARTA